MDSSLLLDLLDAIEAVLQEPSAETLDHLARVADAVREELDAE